MNTLIVLLMLSKMPGTPSIYPFPPANPCSNPVKCDRYRAMPLPGHRQPIGPRR